MGLVHPILVVGMVGGRRRPLAAIHLRFADPDWGTLEITRRVLTYLEENYNYLELDLAFAAQMTDHDWSEDLEAEYWRCKEEMENLSPEKKHIQKLLSLQAKMDVPKFPLVHTCLLLGAMTPDSSCYICSPSFRPWNSAPDWGGEYMWQPGTTVIDATDLSYCFVLPAEDSFHETEEKQERYAQFTRRPISGREWLTAFGLQSRDPEYDEIRTGEGSKIAPVMSIEALQEVWPSFLSEENYASEAEPKYNKKGKSKSKQQEEEEEDAQEKASVTKKRHRKADGATLDERNLAIIEDVLQSGSEGLLSRYSSQKGFLTTLERFVYEHPERLRADCPGAVLLLLDALADKRKSQAVHLSLRHFINLSGDQVVELVRAVLARKKQTKNPKPLALVLDISFLPAVGPAHVKRVLDLTHLEELIIWDNPNLPLDEVTKVAEGRIAKTTTRARFLEPLERRTKNIHHRRLDDLPAVPLSMPPTTPTRTRIRQVVWMTLTTPRVDVAKPQPDKAITGELQLQGPPGTLSLEKLSVEALAFIMHPFYRRLRQDANHIFAELVSLPLYDTWMPLAEFITSLTRFEKYMANDKLLDRQFDLITDRWPLALALLMATGNTECPYVVSSPFPAEAFDLATQDVDSFKFPLRTRGFDPIVHGEYTAVFLREPDLGRLRYGLVTRDAQGQLEVWDPADVADAADDVAARLAWSDGIGALPQWVDETREEDRAVKLTRKEKKKAQEEGRSSKCQYGTLLDVAAVEMMMAAAAELSSRKEEIGGKIIKMDSKT